MDTKLILAIILAIAQNGLPVLDKIMEIKARKGGWENMTTEDISGLYITIDPADSFKKGGN